MRYIFIFLCLSLGLIAQKEEEKEQELGLEKNPCILNLLRYRARLIWRKKIIFDFKE